MAYLPTAELLRRALAAAQEDPEQESPERWRLVNALHDRPEPEVLKTALAWVQGDSATEKVLGSSVLAKLGGEELPFQDETLGPLLDLLNDPRQTVQQSAILALGFHNLAGKMSRFKELVDHPSWEVRDALAIALGPQQDPIAVKLLIRLSSDSHDDVRNWATFGLGTASEADTPALRAALAARLTDEQEEIRGEALLGLALRRDARAVDPLRRELERKAANPLAVEAAKELGSPDFLPALEALKPHWSEDEELLREAIEACSPA